MSVEEQKAGGEKTGSEWQWRLRRFWAPFSIIATVLYVWFYFGEVYHYYHPTGEAETSHSISDSMKKKIDGQLKQLSDVDPGSLTAAYENTLRTADCNWLFQCTDPVRPRFKDWREQFWSIFPAQPEVQLFYRSGMFYIPTARTIKGTPHALLAMVRAIRDAGGYAILMFLSCSVIYIAIVLGIAREKNSAWLVYCMILGSLLAISVMVSGMQWVGEFALRHMGVAFARLTQLLAPSGALALIVAIPHIMEAPHKVKEATKTMREGHR